MISKKKICPVCQGSKKTELCECNMEWRAVSGSDLVGDDCRCSMSDTCAFCHGKGYVSK